MDSSGALRARADVFIGSSVFYENRAGSILSDIVSDTNIVSLGFNFFTAVDMVELVETETDQFNPSAAELLNFGLDVLTPNAGGVATHPLLADSALINAGASAEAGNADSRGVVRDAFPDVLSLIHI